MKHFNEEVFQNCYSNKTNAYIPSYLNNFQITWQKLQSYLCI